MRYKWEFQDVQLKGGLAFLFFFSSSFCQPGTETWRLALQQPSWIQASKMETKPWAWQSLQPGDTDVPAYQSPAVFLWTIPTYLFQPALSGGFRLYATDLYPNWLKAQIQVSLMGKLASPTLQQHWTREHFCIYFTNLVCLRTSETKSQNAKWWLKRITVLLGYFQLLCSDVPLCTKVLCGQPHRIACYF